jgi:hypothetical protein
VVLRLAEEERAEDDADGGDDDRLRLERKSCTRSHSL